MCQEKLKRLIPAGVCMLALIVQGNIAVAGIQKGIEVCLYRLIPSLFPFLVLSRLLTSAMLGMSTGVFRPLCKICRIPPGSESLLLVGFLGGYPVGAGNVAELYRQGILSRSDALRMAVFCNNAGPAFLFGVLGPLFSEQSTLWQLWAVHILSALLCGVLLPGGSSSTARIPEAAPVSLTHCLNSTVRTMGTICGWVVLFSMILEYLENWILLPIPKVFDVLLSGVLELSNGCIGLEQIENEDYRFLMAAVMLSFGGICVWLQTASLCNGLNLSRYLPGKLLQAVLAAALSVAGIFLRRYSKPGRMIILIAVLALGSIFLRKQLRIRKKEVAI